MEPIKFFYLPAQLLEAVKAKNIKLEDLAMRKSEVLSNFTDQDLALADALSAYPVLIKKLGIKSDGLSKFDDRGFDRLFSVIRPLSETDMMKARVEESMAGNHVEGSDSIKIVDMGERAIGIVFGHGALDALRQDNYVLALLTAIVQKVLVFVSVQDAMSACNGLMSAFITTSAFANTNRAPNPVYR